MPMPMPDDPFNVVVDEMDLGGSYSETELETPSPDQARDSVHPASCSCHHCAIVTNLDSVRADSFHERFPEAKFKDDPNCEVDRHIWSDLDLQLNHFTCCHDEDSQRLLKVVYKKVHYERQDGEPGYWNNQRVWSNYDARASILTLSYYEKRVSFCLCGYRRKDGKSSGCGDVTFCPRCCFNLRTEPILEEYGEAFGADREAWFITLAPSRDVRERTRLIYKDLTQSEMEQIKVDGLLQIYENPALKFLEAEHYTQCQAYWDIFKRVMEEAVEEGWLSGFVGAPELAVRFRPLGVLPHSHYVAFSPGFCSDNLRAMRRLAKAFIRHCRRISDKMHPSLAAYRITTQEDYQAVLKYCFKPIPIEQAYERAAIGLNYAPASMRVLNEEVNVFMEGVDLAFYFVCRVHRKGICQALSEHYCGHVTPVREKKRERERDQRCKRKAEKAELELAQSGKTRRRHRSQEEKDASLEMRLQYRRLVCSGDIPAPVRKHRRRRPPKAGSDTAKPVEPQSVPLLPPKPPRVPLGPALRQAIQKMVAESAPHLEGPRKNPARKARKEARRKRRGGRRALQSDAATTDDGSGVPLEERGEI
jgi:hypothetical protein